MERDRPFNSASSQPFVGRPIQSAEWHPAQPAERFPRRLSSAPQPSIPSSPISLTIDRLTLHGFSQHQAAQLSDRLQPALTRLFIERGTPPGLTQAYSLEQLPLQNLQIRRGATVEEIAAQIAQAIYASLSPPQTFSAQTNR